MKVSRSPIVTAVFLALAACSSSFPTADKVVYRFGDSSVPPEYHRSYTVTVTGSEAKIVVKSYNTLINEVSVNIGEGDFKNVMQTIRSSGIARQPSLGFGDCTGGTTDGLAIFEGGTELFNAEVYNCGGSRQGTLAGDAKAVREKIVSLFPNFQEILKR